MKNAKAPITMSLLTVIAVAATAYLFFSLTEATRRSDTFGFTVAYICFLEILLFSFIGNAKSHNKVNTALLGATYPVLAIITSGYILFGLLAVLSHHLILHDLWPSEYYYLTIFTGSVLGVVSIGLVSRFDHSQKIIKYKDMNNKNTLAVFAEELELLNKQYRRLLNTNAISRERDSENTLIQKLADKARFCNPMVAGAPDFETECQATIVRLKNILEGLKGSSFATSLQLMFELEDYVSVSINELEKKNRLSRR
jgi:hypothetical protein